MTLESIPDSKISPVSRDSADSTPRPLRIGELAASAGVSPDTVRHYERCGLLPRAERSAGGYREFPAEAMALLRTIRAALAVGFSIPELARILGERRNGGAPCRKVRALAADKLADVERQQRELRAVRRTLVALLADWDARLEGQPGDRPAHLLEQLSTLDSATRLRAAAEPARTRTRLRRKTKEKPR